MKKALALILLALFIHSPKANALTVEEVEVEGLYSASKEELIYYLGLEKGEEIDPLSIRRGIKRAFLKGIFEDISVEAEGGILKVRVKEREFVEDVSVRGNLILPNAFVRDNFLLKEGSELRRDLLDEAVSHLLRAIRDKGFPDAEVTAEIQKRPEPYRADVVIRIKEGTPAVVDKIRIYGRPEDEVWRVMELKEGDVFDQFRLREDIERLRLYFVEQGYLSPAIGPYTFKDGELGINTSVGERLVVEFSGNKAIKARSLLEVMPFAEAGEFSEELVEEAVAKVISLYHKRGYPFAQVAPVIDHRDGEVGLKMFIFEAEKVKVRSVKFLGVTLDEKRLKALLALREGKLYNPELVDEDEGRIREFYIALGYVNVSVEKPKVEISGSKADIVIKVSEGEAVKIASLSFEGMIYFSGPELRKAAGIKDGAPYNEVDLANARYKILDMYAAQGFADAEVEIRRNFEPQGAVVVFAVKEGHRTYFGRTVIRGNKETKVRVIERELAYSGGKPYRYALLARSRQSLYRLGLFTSVTAEAAERYGDKTDIAVKVEEGKAGAVEVGVGYGEYERWRGVLDISYRNLGGMNRLIGLRTEVSTLENRNILNYYEPWLLGRRIPFRAFLLREERREKNIDTGETRFRIRRYTASVGTERKVGRHAKADVYYEFSLVETFDVRPDVVLSREDTGTLAISGIKPGIVFDTRDNAFDPKGGVFAGVSVKTATNTLFSDTDFVKAIVQGSAYRKLARWLVAAVSLKVGAADGFRETDELPIIERFFLGGRNTVRGYSQDMLGPIGSGGNPTGGNAFMLANLELRTYIGPSWSIVAFSDGGNVWPSYGDIAPDDLKYTAGLGIRYNTPVGPIRLDYGRKLEPEAGESKYEIHFSIGHAF